MVLYILGLKAESEEFYCQTTYGEFCEIEVDHGKLYCPFTCTDDEDEDTGNMDENRQLIVDLTTLDEGFLKHSRLRRQISPFENPTVGAFTVSLLFELSRMFIDGSIR